MLERRHDQAAELDERLPARVDGAAAREQQYPQSLLALSRTRQGWRLNCEPAAGSANRVERVVFTAQSTFAAGVAADLEYRLAALAEVAGEAGALVASALDRPGTSAAGVPLRETNRIAITACARLDHRLREYPSRGSGDDRERVLIAVGVDTDHVIQLVCKHPTDPPFSRRVR